MSKYERAHSVMFMKSEISLILFIETKRTLKLKQDWNLAIICGLGITEPLFQLYEFSDSMNHLKLHGCELNNTSASFQLYSQITISG
jgi:hypothetical protein